MNYPKGRLRIRNEKWHARFYVGGREYTMPIGRLDEMTRQEAELALRETIKATCSKVALGSRLRDLAPIAIGADDGPLVADQNQARRSHRTGAAGELMVAADLLRRGFEVFRPLNPYCEFDLLAGDGDGFLRVEVKTADVSRATPVVNVERNLGKFDLLAVVTTDGRIRYLSHGACGSDLDLKKGRVRMLRPDQNCTRTLQEGIL